MPSNETRLHYRAIERIVLKKFGTVLNFLKAAGVTPGMIPEFDVTTEIPRTQNYLQTVSRLMQGKPVSRNAAIILNFLAVKGILKPGRYVVSTYPEKLPLRQYIDLLQATKTPASAECRAFRDRHRQDETLIEQIAKVDQACHLSLE